MPLFTLGRFSSVALCQLSVPHRVISSRKSFLHRVHHHQNELTRARRIDADQSPKIFQLTSSGSTSNSSSSFTPPWLSGTVLSPRKRGGSGAGVAPSCGEGSTGNGFVVGSFFALTGLTSRSPLTLAGSSAVVARTKSPTRHSARRASKSGLMGHQPVPGTTSSSGDALAAGRKEHLNWRIG